MTDRDRTWEGQLTAHELGNDELFVRIGDANIMDYLLSLVTWQGSIEEYERTGTGPRVRLTLEVLE